MRSNRISLCMIALNESEAIGDAIRSCAGVVDEVVVADGGSGDGTQEIALSLNARILNVPWQDDFSHARNATIAAAQGDWIFVLDCDERLRPGSRLALLDAVRRTDASAFLVTRFEHRKDAVGSAGCSQTVRLGRRDLGVRMRRRIHEIPVEPFARVGNSTIEIDHLGSVLGDIEVKALRNIRLLELQLSEDPSDGYLWTDLAYHYFSRRDKRWIESAARAAALLDVDSSQAPHAMAPALLEMVMRAPTGLSLPVSQSVASELAARWFPASLPLTSLRMKVLIDRRRDLLAARLGMEALARHRQSIDPAPFNREEVLADIRLFTGFALARAGREPEARFFFETAAQHPAAAAQAQFYLQQLLRR